MVGVEEEVDRGYCVLFRKESLYYQQEGEEQLRKRSINRIRLWNYLLFFPYSIKGKRNW